MRIELCNTLHLELKFIYVNFIGFFELDMPKGTIIW